jgi:hypothetical protein
VECAIKIHKERNPNIDIVAKRAACTDWGGDGFPISFYAAFDKVKDEYQKPLPVYFDCRSSPGSLCQHNKDHDPSTMKTYSIKVDGKEKQACLCQDHYDRRDKMGWHAHYELKPMQEPIELNSLKIGDRILFEIDGEKLRATVLSGGSTPALYLEEARNGSWHLIGEQAKEAIKLGLDPKKPRGWYAYKDQVKVLKVGRKEIPTLKIKPSDLKAGQRLKVEHQDQVRWATVMVSKGDCAYGTEETLIYCDEPMEDYASWMMHSHSTDFKITSPVAQKLGLDLSKPHLRYIRDDDAKVLEVEDKIKISALKVGDRVHVLVNNEKHVWGTVICATSPDPILHLDEPISFDNAGLSWSNAHYDTTAAEYGLTTGAKNYWTAYPHQVAIIAKGKPLEKVKDKDMAKAKYKVGERLKVRIVETGKDVIAHVLVPNEKHGVDEHPLIYLPPRNHVGWSATKLDHKDIIKRLGLGNGTAANCYYMTPGEVELIQRLDPQEPELPEPDDSEDEEQTTKGEEDMSKKKKYKVGDRIKIKVDSSYPFTGWATVISLKGFEGDSDQPLLYLDDEQDDTWPWDEEWQRKAAVKAGLDPEIGCFWWLNEDDDTTVLETEDKMEEKSFTGMVKSDMVEAGYRVASNQMTKGVKAGLLRMFKDKGADQGKLAIVQELLDSEVGSAVIALLMGHGMGYIPKLNEDPRFQKLAKEFRIGGMSAAGNVLMDTVMMYLAPAVMEAVSNLPPVSEVVSTVSEKAGIKKKTKKRVAPSVGVKAKEETHEHEEETSDKKVALSAPV